VRQFKGCASKGDSIHEIRARSAAFAPQDDLVDVLTMLTRRLLVLNEAELNKVSWLWWGFWQFVVTVMVVDGGSSGYGSGGGYSYSE
jgi:hypothetical protein